MYNTTPLFYQKRPPWEKQTPGKRVVCKPDFKKIVGVYLGFIGKLNIRKRRFQNSNMCIVETLGQGHSAEPGFKNIVGVGLGFIKKLNTTKHLIFLNPQHVHLENPWKTSISAKLDCKRNRRVGLGFTRKLNTANHWIFKRPDLCSLESPRKTSTSAKLKGLA